MSATIKIKNSSTTGAVPTSSDLVQGELAVNVTDLGLYTENASGTVVKLNAPSIDDKNTGATKHLTISTGGNAGLGVTPSAWAATYKTAQVGNGGAVYGRTNSTQVGLSANYYSDGTDRYIASAAATAYIQSAGVHYWYNAASGTAGNAISFTQAMTLDASGNLGIASTSPTTDSLSSVGGLVIGGGSGAKGLTFFSGSSTQANIAFTRTAGSQNGLIQYDHSVDAMRFFTAASERARIDTSGNLLVGKTALNNNVGISLDLGSSGVKVVSSSSTGSADGFEMYSTGAGAYRFFVSFAGTINATSTTITGISDQRLKENIRDLDDGLEKVMALKPRKFDWKEGKGADIKNARGFIAQEFEEVFPDMIQEWKDPAPEGEEPYKAVNANLIPTLVKAIQELKAEFDAYKATHP